MDGIKQWLWTIAAVAAVLAAASLLQGGTIYNIDGTFVTSFVNQESAKFTGTLEFPLDTVQTGTLKLSIEGEQPLVREVPFDMVLDMPGTPQMPWDTRMFAGVFEDAPMTMFATDFDMQAGLTTDATLLEGGGGWDNWTVSFPDWTVGSIDYMSTTPQVTEPSAMALLAVGAVLLMGMAREAARR